MSLLAPLLQPDHAPALLSKGSSANIDLPQREPGERVLGSKDISRVPQVAEPT